MVRVIKLGYYSEGEGRVYVKGKISAPIAKRASDVMTQTRLRQTNWNGG